MGPRNIPGVPQEDQGGNASTASDKNGAGRVSGTTNEKNSARRVSVGAATDMAADGEGEKEAARSTNKALERKPSLGSGWV